MILGGDCLEKLKELDSDSIDSLVTDPPAGISFMGKEWDHHKGGRDEWIKWLTDVMRECYRVLKPGAHGLVWAIPRTSHWTATALENAGFEIRDVVTHLFGSGFPKSMDISKAIDKAAKAKREVVGYHKNPASSLGNDINMDGGKAHDVVAITAPATESAKKWQGYGTALKPASEHWILIRKPISEKTVAKNVLKYGTGGINIDGSRINLMPGEVTHGSGAVIKSGATYSKEGECGFKTENERRGVANLTSTKGRFPANLVLSHNDDCEDECTEGCAVTMLDQQSGNLGSGGNKTGCKKSELLGWTGTDNVRIKDTGGASRFFYCAKASKSDRGLGNNHPTVKSTKLMSYLVRLITPQGGTVLDPFMGSGSTGVAAKKEGFGFIGIEREPEYLDIASKRIAEVSK
jgi:hypothetical protein